MKGYMFLNVRSGEFIYESELEKKIIVHEETNHKITVAENQIKILNISFSNTMLMVEYRISLNSIQEKIIGNLK